MFYDKLNNVSYDIDTKELRELFESYKYENEFDIYYFDEEHKVCKLAYIPIDFLINKSKTLKITEYYSKTA